MILLINYSNNLYKTSQKLNSKTGIEVGSFDKVISYSPKDIDKDFYKKNKHILDQKRGNGFWLWKPYFIKKSLETLNGGDFLFYCDSGSYFLRSIRPLIDISLDIKQDIIPFELSGFKEKEWTKRDAFVYMDCDSPKFTDSYQRVGGYSLWKKSEFSMKFVNEYLFYAQDERIITDDENTCGLPNYHEFRKHRHDQSIFSLLTKKYNLNVFRDPANPLNTNLSEYKQLINLTRKRDLTLKRKLIRTLRRTKRKYFEKKNKN